MLVCLPLSMGNPYIKFVCQNAWAELRGPNMRMLKVSFGSLKQSADYNFCSLSIPSSGRLNTTCDTHYSFLLNARAALAWMKKKTGKKHSLRNEKLKANRPSETEEQRKERLRI